MSKVIVIPNGAGGEAGTWHGGDDSTDNLNPTISLSFAKNYADTATANARILVLDPSCTLGLYSSNPATPPPPPPGV